MMPTPGDFGLTDVCRAAKLDLAGINHRLFAPFASGGIIRIAKLLGKGGGLCFVSILELAETIATA
jgi:hypothetical protein